MVIYNITILRYVFFLTRSERIKLACSILTINLVFRLALTTKVKYYLLGISFSHSFTFMFLARDHDLVRCIL